MWLEFRRVLFRSIGDFEFKNTSLAYENNNTVLETTVTNSSNKPVTVDEFKIIVKDIDGQEIVT